MLFRSLELAGLRVATPEEIAAQSLAASSGDLSAAGLTSEALAERRLIAANIRNFLATKDGVSLAGNPWFTAQTAGAPEDAAAVAERRLTAQTKLTPLPLVRVHSMLLPDARTANELASGIRSESDFVALARRFSLVRREVGGAYTKDIAGGQVAVNQLEPELQIAVLGARQTGLLRVVAPFGRVWLAYLSPTPKPQLTFGFSYFSSLTTLSGPVYFSAGSFDPTRQIGRAHV